MGDVLVVSVLGPDRRAALLVDDRLRRIAFSPPIPAVTAGDVYLGRITAVDRRLAASFVDIGETRPGFLMLADLADPERPPGEGARVLCRVLRPAEAGKGAKLSARPPFPPDLLARAERTAPPARLAAAPAAVDRLIAAADPRRVAAVIVDDGPTAALLRRSRPLLADRLRLEPGKALFALFGIDAELEAALAPAVPLPTGGRLLIHETPAAAAIDVDLAAGGAGATDGGAAVAATNLAAMAEIARQIGLRDLAGRIVIDPLAGRDRRLAGRMLAALRAGLADDAAIAGDDARVLRIGGFTRLGLIELTRERRGRSLAATLLEPCRHCDGGRVPAPWLVAGEALRRLIAEAHARPGPLPRLRASPAVADVLAGPMADARRAAETRLGGAVGISVDPAPGRPFCTVDAGEAA